VLTRLADAGAGLLLATLDGLEDGSLRAQPQPAEGVSLAPKVTVEDARVDWTAPALRVDRLVRACTPSPGAWTTMRGRRVKLGPVGIAAPGTSSDGDATLAPGELAVSRTRVLVGTGSVAVQLGEVRPEGRGPMSAADWMRGLHPEPLERLE
jgi:methionyl-tRNA formyltransferase